MRRRLQLFHLLGLILLVIGCSRSDTPSAVTPADSTSSTVFTHVVQQGTVMREIEFSGQVVPVAEIQLYFRTSGYVDQIHVHQGQQVKVGVVLAELGGDNLKNLISTAEFNLALAQAQAAEAERENAYLISLGEIALNSARWELTTTLLLDTHAVEAAVDRAEIELEHLREGVSPIFAVQVKQAELALDRLREDTQLVAQMDGIVTSVLVYPGQLVGAFQPVILLANTNDIEVRAFPSQEQARRLFESQPVSVTLRNNEVQSWSGMIRYLPRSYSSGYSTDGQVVTDNSTRISLVGADEEVFLGDAVMVKVVLNQKNDVLWLPPDAIRTFQDRAFVIAQVDGGQRRVDIETGIVGQDRVEITKGLNIGQVVIAP